MGTLKSVILFHIHHEKSLQKNQILAWFDILWLVWIIDQAPSIFEREKQQEIGNYPRPIVNRDAA
jgi:hypothetical protein